MSNTEKENFITAFKHHVDRDPDVLFLAGRAYGNFILNGDLMTNEQAQNDVIHFVEI